ncbi:iron-sulfur cluster co-chaperone protein HscB isoform X2 [Syngnathoides biaculeatus]|uniref:iron-sulfur cluster co-chaperone protein HscB isoform X2 n=1 Tax=Syngnathoides biaculeatus TaxID=300417 RepID=UPI002ADDB601|nr:iron-sulfur cluster co-chaperone protein HscB isoform X2 [Syngnathoides biaculeatus]
MASLIFLRTVGLFRTLPHTRRLATSRPVTFKVVTCPAHCAFCVLGLSKDAWSSKMALRTTGLGRHWSCCFSNDSSVRSYSTDNVLMNCWKCKEPFNKSPTFFCSSCKVLQPPDEGASFFNIMDCEDTFVLDMHKLQKRYLELQRSLHPDNFSQKSAEEQEYSAHQSALVNKAYQTLLKPLSRGLYMLELKGMRIDEGTHSGVDAEFLMELMEINEALEQAETPEEADRISQDTKGKLKGLTAQIDSALHAGRRAPSCQGTACPNEILLKH